MDSYYSLIFLRWVRFQRKSRRFITWSTKLRLLITLWWSTCLNNQSYTYPVFIQPVCYSLKQTVRNVVSVLLVRTGRIKKRFDQRIRDNGIINLDEISFKVGVSHRQKRWKTDVSSKQNYFILIGHENFGQLKQMYWKSDVLRGIQDMCNYCVIFWKIR